jgi:uncharacterized membrane protein
MRLSIAIAFSFLALALHACSSTPANPTPDAAPVPAGRFFPCDVEAAVKARCQICHTTPPVMSAPFPLLEYADTQKDYGGGQKVWEAMKRAIETGEMPQRGSPSGPLTPEQKATLLTWLGAGALAASQPCPGGS